MYVQRTKRLTDRYLARMDKKEKSVGRIIHTNFHQTAAVEYFIVCTVTPHIIYSIETLRTAIELNVMSGLNIWNGKDRPLQ